MTLDVHDRQTVLAVLSRHLPPGVRVRVFGSRATGQARPFSDLDLMIIAEQPLSLDLRAELSEAFEVSSLPFRVDLVEAMDMPEAIRRRALAESIPIYPPGAIENEGSSA
ncbi:MAG: nucleotidyltransferase family protein [Casimicrobiaceae bacterium]